MVFDCFLFFNELELLELRLKELSSIVDKFVLVEATQTYSGLPKPLYFMENKERFSDYLSVINHIIVEDIPKDNNRWRCEIYQRNAIARGLSKCQPDDIILISDADEIPNPQGIKELKELPLKRPLVFKQKFFYYFVNGMVNSSWNGTVAIRYRYFKTPQQLRNKRNSIFIDTHPACKGWHFSYLGDEQNVAYKIRSFAHKEYDKPFYTDLNLIRMRIRQGKDLFGRRLKITYIPIDDTFPKSILDNLAYWKKYIKEHNVST